MTISLQPYSSILNALLQQANSVAQQTPPVVGAYSWAYEVLLGLTSVNSSGQPILSFAPNSSNTLINDNGQVVLEIGTDPSHNNSVLLLDGTGNPISPAFLPFSMQDIQSFHPAAGLNIADGSSGTWAFLAGVPFINDNTGTFNDFTRAFYNQ